jgi:hypothetical protein
MLAAMRRRLVAPLLIAVLVSCGDAALEPLPFQVGLDASRVVSVPGDTILFGVTAQGGNLFGVEMDYGDGVVEPYGTAGARTARVTFRHAFKLKGTYTVSVTATDATAGQKKAGVEVRVN